VVLLGGSSSPVGETVFSAMSSTTPIRKLIRLDTHSKSHPDASRSRDFGAHRPVRYTKRRGGDRASDTLLAAEAEFGPEHPHSVAELTQPEITTTEPQKTQAPAVSEPPRPSRGNSSPSGSQPGGEFGFEAPGK
jgi:hypothetical protein